MAAMVVLPSPATLAAFQRRLLDWYAANGRDLPWRRTRDPYAVLVSEVMLQQTQVARVVPRYLEWMARFPTLESLAAAPLGEVLRRWQGLGYNTRARRLRDCAVAVVARAAGAPARLPRGLAALERLPGVGPYTARAVLVFAHNEDVAAVDANVRRVLTWELGLPPDLDRRSLQEVAEAVLPRGRSRDWHNALMDYGALVLTSRRTGLGPARRQAPFRGSRRELRARLVRLLLDRGPCPAADLAPALAADPDAVAAALAGLAADGLVTVADGVAAVPDGDTMAAAAPAAGSADPDAAPASGGG